MPRIFLLFAVLTSFAAAAETGRPTTEEQTAMLADAAKYAEDYVHSLPNFICMRVNQQFEGNKKGDKWHKGDTLTSRLEFRDGREKRTLQLVNDKPLSEVTKRWRTPLRTEGEFGGMLVGIFADSSNASFDWDRWDTVRGHEVAVFKYSIDQAHSALKLGDELSGTFALPYHGFFAMEKKSGIVFEVNVTADEIPSALRSRDISTTIEYDKVQISTQSYVLPVHAVVLLKTDRDVVRNEMNFEQYRKFEAESNLKFDTDNASQSDQPTEQHR
jgi:hypothetical protein